jgi:hypothetical protein
MNHAQGKFTAKVGGKSYTLWVGMSVLADLQATHGHDVLSQMTPPEGAGTGWMPNLQIAHDLFAGALERYHPDVAGDRWLVDDIIAENADAYGSLMGTSFPDETKAKPVGNVKRAKKAAS